MGSWGATSWSWCVKQHFTHCVTQLARSIHAAGWTPRSWSEASKMWSWTPETWRQHLRLVTPSLLREIPVEIPETQWEDVGGLGVAKDILHRYVEVPLRNRMDLTELPGGIVLYGPTGTGKTMLVKALASGC